MRNQSPFSDTTHMNMIRYAVASNVALSQETSARKLEVDGDAIRDKKSSPACPLLILIPYTVHIPITLHDAICMLATVNSK